MRAFHRLTEGETPTLSMGVMGYSADKMNRERENAAQNPNVPFSVSWLFLMLSAITSVD